MWNEAACLALVYSVLRRAILDTKSNDRIVCREAWRWFQDSERCAWSFAWCCDVLEVDRDRVLAIVEIGDFSSPEQSAKSVIARFCLDECPFYEIGKPRKKPIYE